LTFGCGGNDNASNTSSSNAAATTGNNANRNTNTAAANNANATNANNGRPTFNANISQEEYEKTKEGFSNQARELGDKVGTSLSDGWLWTKTRGALMSAADLEETGINVDVNNGVIILRGTVPSNDQVKKADAAAKSVSGSKGVQNQLKVGAGGNTGNGNKNSGANR
jgi:nanoRNase/pAp phosphatase (c-di-AMP/oligoRNAs hydrolase)